MYLYLVKYKEHFVDDEFNDLVIKSLGNADKQNIDLLNVETGVYNLVATGVGFKTIRKVVIR